MKEIPEEIWSEIASGIDHSPRVAYCLASIALAIATSSNSPSLQARARLAWLRALCARGEFARAAALGPSLSADFAARGDRDGQIEAWRLAAFAESYLGNLDRANADLDALRAATGELDAITRAHVDWIEGRLLREQGEFTQAAERFERARAAFAAGGDGLDAVRCRRELGHTRSGIDSTAALIMLEEARHAFEDLDCPADAALCNYWYSQTCEHLNRFEEALARLAEARHVFMAQGIRFFVALCDLDQGLLLWERNDYESALRLFEQARVTLDACGAQSEVISCDINIGLVYLYLNRYDEAMPRFERAAEQSLASGRRRKAAICFNNLGWAADRQGNYAQALSFYERARDEFALVNSPRPLAMCERNLGLTFSNLGQSERALAALERARAICERHNLKSDLAESELYRAEALLALSRRDEAIAALQGARQLFEQVGQPVYVAFCDRLLANTQETTTPAIRARLRAARRLFMERGQIIDAALCDLTLGELHVRSRNWKSAEQSLHRALGRLHPGFPDQAWRADYALGKVAVARRDRKTALSYYLSAIRKIAGLRAGLTLEQLSNGVFGARQAVFEEALQIADQEADEPSALTIIESAKAQVFLSYLLQHDWQARPGRGGGEEWEALSRRERELRYQLADLRSRVSVQEAETQGAVPGESRDVKASKTLAAIHTVSDEYEQVVGRLRLLQQGLAGVPSLAPFSLQRFRALANARWGKRWAALDYFLTDTACTVAYIDPREVELYSVPLDDYAHYALAQCCGTEPDLREMVYRGTIRKSPVPSSGKRFLQYLAEQLIPDRILESTPGLTVIVSPHGPLHQLPFHALMQGESYLLDRFSFVYAPSLQAWAQLNSGREAPASGGSLVCGLDEFGGRARALPFTAKEVEALEQALGSGITTLWKQEATRGALAALQQSGRLREFGIVHFATHAIIEPQAPHLSRVLLADDDLTVLDVMNFDLGARLVTLAACSTALGHGGHGDEFVGLVRAFFYAGTRALVASLWGVEDESVPELMGRFYRRLTEGEPIAGALRGAQIEMRRAGSTPFQWAPFVAMGDV